MAYTALNISSGSVNIRSTPSASGNPVGTVTKGATVTLTPVSNNDRWFAISGGYVAGEFFQMQTSGIGTLITAGFTGQVNVRYEPNTSAGTTSVVFKLYIGQVLTKLQEKSGWSQVTCALGTGWISNEYLQTYTGPSVTPTLMYGTVKGNGYLNVRNSPTGSSIHKLPGGRLVVYESPAVDGFVKVKWRGSTGWVMESYLENKQAADVSCRLRLAAIGLQEENATTIRSDVQEEEFYGAPNSTSTVLINYCHYFADTLASTAWYDPQNLPMEGNCKDGVKFFLQKGQFYFVSAAHKAAIYDDVSDMRPYLNYTRDLTTFDRGYSPNPGAYIYFRTIEGETSSHVGIVTEVTTNKIYTIEGNVGSNRAVGRREYARSGNSYAAEILGFAVPTMS